MSIIGITGTRKGLNQKQRIEIEEFLSQIPDRSTSELHHGDCVGVDVEVAEIARKLGFITVSHPPLNSKMQAHHKSDHIRAPAEYLERNREIVDEVELMLAAPLEETIKATSGTWYTMNYSIHKKKPIVIFFPFSEKKLKI